MVVGRRHEFDCVAPPTALEKVAEGLVATVLVFAPVAFGSTQAWSQEIFFALIAAATLCIALRNMLNRRSAPTWRWVYAPIILFILLCAAQLVPLPLTWMRTLSPATAQIKSDLLQGTAGAESLSRVTLSFYPLASWGQLRLVLAVAALFWVALELYRNPQRIRRLLLIVVLTGLVVAGIAVYQNMSGSDTIYGLIPAGHRNSGPFMNYSHFGQFMNLSLGAALALLLVEWVELASTSRGEHAVFQRLCTWGRWRFWLALALLVLGPITIFLSMARMGMLSLMIAGMLTGLTLTWRSRQRGPASIVLTLGIVVFAGLLYFGFDAVYSRLATLRHIQAADGGRVQMLKDIAAEARHFPVLGTGLGTHEFVFPMFDRSNIALIATHAENEYAQLFEECGLAGVALAGAFLLMIAIRYLQAIKRPKAPIDYAAFGLGFGLIAVLIHSLTDFGQHVPSNAALTAMSCALLSTLATRPWRPSAIGRDAAPAGMVRAHSMPRVWQLGLSGAALVSIAGVWIAVLFVADRARRAEGWWGRAEQDAQQLELAAWHGGDQDFIDLLAHANTAAGLEPGNVTYQYRLNAWRWRAISRNEDPATHAIVLDADSVGFAAQIVREMDSARALCPTYGPPWSLSGSINLDVLQNESLGISEIERGYRLSPYDSSACLSIGELALRRGDDEAAVKALTRFTLLGGQRREAMGLCLAAGKADLAYTLAKGHRDCLQYLGDTLGSKPRDAAEAVVANRAREEATALLAAEAQAPGAPAQVMAQLAQTYHEEGNHQGAIDLYRKALALEYGQVDWRLKLARDLKDAGKADDAAREARICLRLRPQSAEARALLADYSIGATAARGDDPATGRQ